MRLVLHRRVRSDVDEIMDYYERAEQPELAQDFYRELRAFLVRENKAIEHAAFGRVHRKGQLIDVHRTGHVRPIGAKAESWFV
jgi:plasmid stabilization system protein ParE